MKLTELNYNDFATIVKNNSDLTERVYEEAMFEADLMVNDILRDIPRGADYQINNYGYDFISLKGCTPVAIRNYVHDLQKSYCVFPDDLTTELAKYKRYTDVLELDNCGYINICYDDYYFMSCVCDEIRERIENELLKYCQSYYDVDLNYAIESAYYCERLDDIDYDPTTKEVSITTVKILR